MNEQKTGKNKIGARYLSNLEAELILPNYERIYYQIEQFRMEKGSMNCSKIQRADNQNENQSSWNQDKDQKTNNIGIIGVRGAGKTSILKTIRVQLQNSKRKPSSNDIILPLIVPENMSESGTLMATILGMLSEVIKERDEKEQKKQRRDNKDCIRKSSLRTKCEEVIKQYTYIQKEYRDILIQQYTTENAYVGDSAKVFNSDTEFINRFNELIDELLDVKNQNDGLLFLFIDDIDLSTYRCADIVKTLLSYLSNENIVTFISGDLDTFEESLTLDFLRRENILKEDILGAKMGSETLLERKKQLAYEYLKKIIPPAYRYNIKFWSLEERGNYCIADTSENGTGEDIHEDEHGADRQKAGITLSDLLSQALKGWIDPAFFRYAQIEDDGDDRKQNGDSNQDDNKDQYQGESQGKNSRNHEKYQMTGDVLPYTYHLFDDTSRGLNNIYNVLGEIAAARMLPETDELKEKKLLLDTIISSKPIYNKHRNEIQQNFYHVGTAKTDSRVFFDNARAIIYKKDITEVQVKSEEYHITNPIERFSLFILAVFAARLLYENDYESRIRGDKFYGILKTEAMQDLFFHPVIAGKVMEISTYSWENEEEKKLRNAAVADGKKYPALTEMKLKDINRSFLLKGDLVLNLAYYRNLPLEEMLKLYEDKSIEEAKQEPSVTAELEQSTVIAIWKAFSSIAKVNNMKNVSEGIARYYSIFWKEFAYIRNRHSGSVTQNIAIILFDDEVNYIVNKNRKSSNFQNAETEQNNRRMQRILSNTLAKVLRAGDEDEIQDTWQEIQYDNLYIVGKDNEERKVEDDTERKDIEKRVQLLKVIGSNSLWQTEAAEDVAEYLKVTIRRYLKFIKNKLEEKADWKLNTSDAEGSWEVFKKTYVGETMTIARRTRNNVDYILEEEGTDFHQGMSFGTYSSVIEKLQDLAGNNRVWYGQSEAQVILNESQKAFAQPNDGSWEEWIREHSYFKFLLQCRYKYRMETAQSKQIVQNARLLTHITDALSVAHKDADKQTLENFIAELNRNLKKEDQIDSEIYEKLFSN